MWKEPIYHYTSDEQEALLRYLQSEGFSALRMENMHLDIWEPVRRSYGKPYGLVALANDGSGSAAIIQAAPELRKALDRYLALANQQPQKSPDPSDVAIFKMRMAGTLLEAMAERQV